jgi:hypothetical protein
MNQEKLDELSKSDNNDIVDLCAVIHCLKAELAASTSGWNEGDPRQVIYKRANIIILRPISAYHYEAGTGTVETKNGWRITSSFENHSRIEEWDEAWLWSFAPNDPLRPANIK